MDTRRDFLKKAGLLAGGVSVSMGLPPSIQRALAIDPQAGSTFYDAEHVVFLMQENRSFDHCFGTLKGVRGFNDPRAIRLPNQIPVWLQQNKKGETYVPFRLNIKDTRAAWMGGLPHSWENQVDARNQGKYDQWLEAKKAGGDYKHMPLTMGYYNREDLPFYYALADSFTVFDQHFCSSLTGTTANRHFFWTGKLRETPTAASCVRNSDTYYNKEARWKTFPERLEEAGVSWRVYQNEISLQTELKGEDASLLANFTDNNLEWFSQYNVRYATGHQKFLKKRLAELPEEIKALEAELRIAPKGKTQKLKNKLGQKQQQYIKIQRELAEWSPENFEKLSESQKNLHQKAFTTNSKDPYYHQTETLTYEEDGEKRSVKVPKGDILFQFREDVNQGKLPQVSWLVAPQKFSDHPSAPWYGAWYVSEVLDILTRNQEVWKKTIFVLTYDENDGYFDHVPPFVAPHPNAKGWVSEGLDTTSEYVTLEEELKVKGLDEKHARESPVGLGYRVPMLVMSPWSKGGWVNSEVCDISSTLMFLERFLSKKTGTPIRETNISEWRRAVCGDLTSAFRTFDGSSAGLPGGMQRKAHMKEVYNSRFKGLPNNYRPLRAEEIERAKRDVAALPIMPKQESGIKDSNALAYELYADGGVTADKKHVELAFKASNAVFGALANGSPFTIYAPGQYRVDDSSWETLKVWSMGLKAGDSIVQSWPIDNFEGGTYHLCSHGPNGFYREFCGSAADPEVTLTVGYERDRAGRLTGNVSLQGDNGASSKIRLTITDKAYGERPQTITLAKGKTATVVVNSIKAYGWYDFEVVVAGYPDYARRYAGRVETGKPSKTDPVMGGVL